jgi:hypothetical protein
MARLTNDDKWAPVLGRFMIAFGSIESSVNELLRQQCSEAQMKFVLTLMLTARCTLLRHMLAERKVSDEARAILLGTLNEVEGLSKTRNIVAHNPLVLSMFKADDQQTRTMREVIYAEHKDKAIEFDELSRLAARAVRVAASLSQNWIELDQAAMSAREPVLKRP